MYLYSNKYFEWELSLRKGIWLLFIIWAAAVNTEAKCAPSYLSFYPEGDSLERESLIELQFHDVRNKILGSWDTSKSESPLTLISEADTIPLKIFKKFEGQFRSGQVFLKGEKFLQTGLSYQLHADSAFLLGMDEYQREYWTDVLEETHWNVVEAVGENGKIFFPEKVKEVRHELGCGPAVWVHFQDKNLPGKYFFTRLQDLSFKKSSEFWLKSRNGEILVGHGMCSGAFELIQGNKYRVQFQVLNGAGLSLSDWSEWKYFIGP
jgi:hypothetical protein